MFAVAVYGGLLGSERSHRTQKQRSIKRIEQLVLQPDGSWFSHTGFAED